MDTNKTSKHITQNVEQSLRLAQKLATHLPATFTLELVGDLGGGKTTFVKGLAHGLGITQTITSPTFTIHRSYQGAYDKYLEHFDLYRLAETSDKNSSEDSVVAEELIEASSKANAITAVEWAKPLESKLPSDRLIIAFHYIDENSRAIEFQATGPNSAKLLENLQ